MIQVKTSRRLFTGAKEEIKAEMTQMELNDTKLGDGMLCTGDLNVPLLFYNTFIQFI